jgi:hypothetical protein
MDQVVDDFGGNLMDHHRIGLRKPFQKGDKTMGKYGNNTWDSWNYDL